MKITIKDIAQMAGVSISTVSRVINNSKPVNEIVRRRVIEILEQNNFRPNTLARNLATNKSSLIGVCIAGELKNTVLDELIDGINHVSKLYDYKVLFGVSRDNFEVDFRYFRELKSEGIILATHDLNNDLMKRIEDFDVPCIVVGRSSSNDSVPTVGIDNFTASYEAVTYLIQQGHRDIAMIRSTIHDRFQGYQKALTDARIDLNENWIIESGISVEDGMKSMEKICKRPPLPTAVFCETDKIAYGVINYLCENGIRVPDDISVFGFDDLDISSIIRPKLSTVSYSVSEMGMTATRNLIKKIRDKEYFTQNWFVPHFLKIRESTRATRDIRTIE